MPLIGSQPAYSTSQEVERLFGEMIAKHNNNDMGTPFDWEGIVVEGDTATEVARVAAEQRTDLIVMYSRRMPRAATLLDSTAEAISRTAPCPVLITHQQPYRMAYRTAGLISSAYWWPMIFQAIRSWRSPTGSHLRRSFNQSFT